MKKHNIIRTEEGFLIRNGKLYISSQQVSELFKKTHGNILSLIRREIEADNKLKKHAIEDKSTSINNKREVPVFLLTKQGFIHITAKYHSVEEYKNKASLMELYETCENKYKEFKENKSKKFHEGIAESVTQSIEKPVTVIETPEQTIVVPNNTMPTMIYEPVATPQKQHNNMSVPVVQQTQDEPLVIDSRDVAEMVGRNHHDVLRDIRKVIGHLSTESNFALSDYFIESTYQDKTGRSLNCYLLTKKGCELFSTRMTGAKGTQFAVTYIERFNEMEQQLNQTPAIQMPSYAIGDPIERAKMWIEEEQQRMLLAETAETQVKVIEYKDEIIERQVEVIHEKDMTIKEQDKAIQTLKGDIINPINEKFESAHAMSDGLTPYQMAEAIKHMVELNCSESEKHSNWIKLYSSYEGKYNVNLNYRKNAYVKENNLISMSVIDYVKTDMIHICQLYALAKEIFTFKPIKKQNNKTLSLADL